MSRSSKKVPFIAPELLKRVNAMNESGNKEVIKTWSRASTTVSYTHLTLPTKA